MEPPTSKTSEPGTSRFSKALPAPPPALQDMQAPRPPLHHQAPRRHDQQQPRNKPSLARKPLPSSGPPLPPAKEATMAKSLDSPLPPFPSPPGAGPAATAMVSRQPIAGADPPSSPSDSSPLSSILSDYSDRSSDSTMRSSTDGATMSAKGSFSPASAKQDNGVSKQNHHELFVPPLSAMSMDDYIYAREPSEPPMATADSESQPPLLPPKDSTPNEQRSPTHPGVQEQSMQTAPATTSFTQSPPSQPRIWRRRSIKLDKDIAVPELKLASSHGSTALPALPPSQALASATEPGVPREKYRPEQLEPPAVSRVQLPPSPNPAFPGRNVRPMASQQRIAPQAPEGVGREASNPEDAGGKSSSPGNGSETTAASFPQVPSRNPSRPDVAGSAQPLQIARLPTPEYESGDIRSPIAETVISPASPASSPEPLTEAKPRAAPQDLHRLGTKEIRPVKSTTALVGDANSPLLNANPSPSGLTLRSPVGLPSSPAANRCLPSGQNRFPTRTSSKPSENHGAPVVADQREVAVDRTETPRVESQVPPQVGNIQPAHAGLLQIKPASAAVPEAVSSNLAEPKNPTKEDPDTERVPTPTSEHGGWWAPIPEGTIFDSPPILERNLRCLSGHRIMVQSRNTYYPLACQACHVKDTSIRYTCGSCWLRTCTTCRNNLYRFSGNLRALMEHNDAVVVERSEEERREEAQDEGKTEVPVNPILANERAGAPSIPA